MKKELVILGAYPNNDIGIDILKKSIRSLNEHFDVLLVTHYPVDSEIQFLVKYFIYDHRNEFLKNETIHFWADYPNFYAEVYDNKTDTHHSFAVFRNIMNAVNFIKDCYDDFFYIEGDCIFDERDIQNIKHMKRICNDENKYASFFTFPDFLSSLLFYSKVSFFQENFKFCKSTNEYELYCDEIGSYGALENYLYCSVNWHNNFDKIHILKNVMPPDYFPNSSIAINSFFEGKVEFYKSFRCDFVKVDGTESIALVYVNNNAVMSKDELPLYLDDELITIIPHGKFANYYILNPKYDDFVITVGKIKFNCNKNEILKGKSYLKIKND
jgi:hypothetical protein